MDNAEILKKVRQIEIKTGKLVSETFAGEYLSTFKGQGIEFAEVREYIPGDDVRAIDWNVTARAGTPFVKKYNEERELTLIIACDVSGSQHFGSSDKLKQEAAAELTALFALSALQNNDKVGLLLFSDQVELYVPPRKGKKHILRLIREVVAFEPKHTGTDIGMSLETLNKVIKRQGILILISDFIAPLASFAKPFRLAAKKFDLIPVILQDKLERHLPSLGVCIDVTDPETGESDFLSLSSGDLNAALDNYHQEHDNQLRHLFNPYKIEPIVVDTAQDTADPVIAFFKQRAKKLRR
ncbi:DUF58 domain-containing protein [Candidatus Avelusimicrobium luingense]|uniref:DUF58 domain-containing protein n=1 Tax=Candidatus Avelusimicrobium luingense TaxID=3416211 RepID=UPI003D11ACA9